MRKKKPRGILPSKLRASSLDDIKKYVKPLDKFQKGGVGEAFNKVVFPRKSQPKSSSTQSLSQSSGYRRPTPKPFGDVLFDRTFKRDNSFIENAAEIFDPTGVLSWDDAYQARQSWKKSGRTLPTMEEGLDMFGAVPLAGKLASGAKVINLAKRSSKPAKFFLAEMWNKGARHIPNTINRGDAVQDIYQDNSKETQRFFTPKSTLPKYQLAGMVGEGGEDAEVTTSTGQNIGALQRALNNIYPELNLNTDGVWDSKTAEAYKEFKEDYSGSPALSNRTVAASSVLQDILRKQFNKATGLETRPSPRTERDLSAEQLEALNKSAKTALSSNRYYIKYPDYNTEDVNKAYRGEESNLDVVKRMLTDPAYQMKTTLGQADIVITPSSDTLAVDAYDFNPGSYGIEEPEDIGFKEAWEKSKSNSAYKTTRKLAQYLGSDPGDPSSRQSIINIGS